MNVLSKIFGLSGERVIEKLRPYAEKINHLEKDFEKLSSEELKNKTIEFKKRLEEGASLDDLLPEAFAACREAAKRTLKQRHYDSQILGGIVMHQGKIAEMKTGEGKTLVATLPAYLNALTDKGVHIVTVNDYLSRRDATWMGQIYDALGLSVGALNHEASYIYDPKHGLENQKSKIKNQNVNLKDEKDQERDTLGSFKIVHEFLRPCTRREAYEVDITYGTNNEYGFDYLRDNMAYKPEQMVQRGHYFAIVDEVDSILIDESRTPLIISAPDEESGELYRIFSRVVPQLKKDTDFKVDEKFKAVELTEDGIEHIEKILGIGNIYTEKGIKYVHHLEQALRARALFTRDKDYVVKDNEVIIVDEFTGRLMPGRRWSEGLHQAVEAKEGVAVQRESRTLATITFQNYFRMYEKLAGMTGTALTSAEEFHKVYNLEVIEVPTNKPMIRKDLGDKVFQSEKGKWMAVAKEVRERHEKGQPVLLGTVSIEKNEFLSQILKKEGIPHEILNAKNHEREAEIIAQAGKKGRVTLATNIAGRGVDIILGGNPATPEEAALVREAGGLFVLGTERHEARRIDNQLRGRAGRQGDPGETQFFESLEDELMRIFGSERIKGMMGTFGLPEDEPLEHKLVTRAIESAQSKIEGFHFDSRKHVLEYDDVINKQRTAIYSRRKKILWAKDDNVREIAKEYLDGDIDESALVGKEPANLRQLLLQTIDILWMDHLEAMEYMRSSVRLRAYGQRDPLIEYKNEAIRMFRELEASIKAQFTHLLTMAAQPIAQTPQARELKLSREDADSLRQKSNVGNSGENKVGRNDPCPCGSGKKFKKCHGK
ncbi:preprotein translocase subunit SecA [Candidatus Giovannonibacteria bacterium RIFCSPHIGHO2_02_42_15]|uniref:Protein translocase subunit SecA n=1 Tax=Candidatus Giovannonibacteria bacterium RIFCSPHIGHO2_02_42_15 TaxID=1798329 RepID=A0A1F5VQT4_9BACT|nr:MAG: preprotein translocase subunit SecA [Candidatus Giovannonibacteria bacterium RIFCSPHIGHO2_02_42_15]